MAKLLNDSHPSDDILISKGLQGDREALDALFSRYHQLLYSLACRVLGGREEAEDAVQNCMLQAYCKLQHFNHAGAFRSWLVRILVNEAINLRRKSKSKNKLVVDTVRPGIPGEIFDNLASPGPDPEQAFAKKESISSLTKEVAGLTAPLRSTVLLCGMREYSIQEAGKALRVTESTIRARLFRARKQLAAAMISTQRTVCTE